MNNVAIITIALLSLKLMAYGLSLSIDRLGISNLYTHFVLFGCMDALLLVILKNYTVKHLTTPLFILIVASITLHTIGAFGYLADNKYISEYILSKYDQSKTIIFVLQGLCYVWWYGSTTGGFKRLSQLTRARLSMLARMARMQ